MRAGLVIAPPYTLRYDNIGGLAVDGCRLANALFGKKHVHHNARLGERLNIGGMLCHHVVQCERLTVGKLKRYLFGKRLIELGRLRRCLGLGGVLFENMELMRNLAGKVLGSMLLWVIVVPKSLGDDLGRDIASDVHERREHLIVGELVLGASGSHS